MCYSLQNLFWSLRFEFREVPLREAALLLVRALIEVFPLESNLPALQVGLLAPILIDISIYDYFILNFFFVFYIVSLGAFMCPACLLTRPTGR